MRRLRCALLAVGLVGLLLPLSAHAHSRSSTPVSVPTPVETAAASLSAAPPEAPSVAPVLAFAAAMLVAAAGYRRRRVLGFALAALLAVFTAEAAVHSVHHLGERANVTCAVAATAGQLSAAVDHAVPGVHGPPPLSAAVADLRPSRPVVRRFGPDPARAPPAPIA